MNSKICFCLKKADFFTACKKNRLSAIGQSVFKQKQYEFRLKRVVKSNGRLVAAQVKPESF
jgi:hypothetical protein